MVCRLKYVLLLSVSASFKVCGAANMPQDPSSHDSEHDLALSGCIVTPLHAG